MSTYKSYKLNILPRLDKHGGAHQAVPVENCLSVLAGCQAAAPHPAPWRAFKITRLLSPGYPRSPTVRLIPVSAMNGGFLEASNLHAQTATPTAIFQRRSAAKPNFDHQRFGLI